MLHLDADTKRGCALSQMRLRLVVLMALRVVSDSLRACPTMKAVTGSVIWLDRFPERSQSQGQTQSRSTSHTARDRGRRRRRRRGASLALGSTTHHAHTLQPAAASTATCSCVPSRPCNGHSTRGEQPDDVIATRPIVGATNSSATGWQAVAPIWSLRGPEQLAVV